MANANTIRANNAYIRRRVQLVAQFGGECELCHGPVKDGLEFAHRIGFRWIYGPSRGRNARVAEVRRNPERFMLVCKSCHYKYDRENPLTPEEIEMSDKLKSDDVPF